MALQPETVWWSAAAGGTLVTLAALAAARCARGSTAVPAALWGMAAGIAFTLDVGLRAAGLVSQPPAAAAVRLATTLLAIAPALSILGAKRPQHGVWQFIVAAFGLVLFLPAAAMSLVRPGSVPDLHLLGRLLVAVVVLVGWLNHVATGLGPAATLVALGVLLMARGFLPGVDTEAAFPPGAAPAALRAACLDAVGGWLVAAGAALGGLARRRRRRVPALATFAAAVDPAWMALRDTVGAAWALRIAERFDQLAADRGWPCRLGFRGMHPAATPADGAWQRDARRALGALFRRFADEGWLDRHGWGRESRGASRNASQHGRL
ncbi:MAG: hypothetical protein ACKO5R_13275 [Planctomycetaceae bacterium]